MNKVTEAVNSPKVKDIQVTELLGVIFPRIRIEHSSKYVFK